MIDFNVDILKQPRILAVLCSLLVVWLAFRAIDQKRVDKRRGTATAMVDTKLVTAELVAGSGTSIRQSLTSSPKESQMHLM